VNNPNPDGRYSSDVPLAFLPLHKRAFGMALGLAAGAVVFLVTAYANLLGEPPRLVYLLANYFPGYTVSWTGAVVGFAWATFSFFVAGWFCAFLRNLVLTASIWLARTRAELVATRDFLDHI
jgi:hypothetical protein